MDEPLSFGALVRRRRKALDLTQRALAHRVGCAEVTIQKIEAEERRPSTDVAQRLADAFGLTDQPRAAFLRRARGQLDDSAPLPAVPPTATAAAAPPHNLPAELTSFVGRAHELATLSQLLPTSRLLTLSGPGGVGKTRLALRAAAAVRATFPHGVWLVPLAELSDPALVPHALAGVLGLRAPPDRPLLATLVAQLRERHLLLLLDNCEHLVDACADVVNTLLAACPHLWVLATSREPLGIAGEAVLRVPPLALPLAAHPEDLRALLASDAVQLFVQRVRAVQPSFALTPHTAAAVAQICARLDGLPLALELAAARARVLTVAQIAQRVEDRFRLLTGGSRVALPRHQTLEALLEWSYELLDAAEQALLGRLAVFAGGWTLEAAEAVCTDASVPDVLAGLTGLIDKSLVQVEPAGDDLRYRMLETVRQYAQRKLAASGDAERVRQRHAQHYQALAPTAWPLPVDDTWWEQSGRWAAERDNLRAALAWHQSPAGDAEVELRLATLLSMEIWAFGHWEEGQRALERALSHGPSGAHAATRAAAYLNLGELLGMQNHYAAARQAFTQGLALCRDLGDREWQARVLHRLGHVAREQGDTATAWAELRESEALFRALANEEGLAWVLTTMAELAVVEEDAATAAALLAESAARTTASSSQLRHGLEPQPPGACRPAARGLDRGGAVARAQPGRVCGPVWRAQLRGGVGVGGAGLGGVGPRTWGAGRQVAGTEFAGAAGDGRPERGGVVSGRAGVCGGGGRGGGAGGAAVGGGGRAAGGFGRARGAGGAGDPGAGAGRGGGGGGRGALPRVGGGGPGADAGGGGGGGPGDRRDGGGGHGADVTAPPAAAGRTVPVRPASSACPGARQRQTDDQRAGGGTEQRRQPLSSQVERSLTPTHAADARRKRRVVDCAGYQSRPE